MAKRLKSFTSLRLIPSDEKVRSTIQRFSKTLALLVAFDDFDRPWTDGLHCRALIFAIVTDIPDKWKAPGKPVEHQAGPGTVLNAC